MWLVGALDPKFLALVAAAIVSKSCKLWIGNYRLWQKNLGRVKGAEYFFT